MSRPSVRPLEASDIDAIHHVTIDAFQASTAAWASRRSRPGRWRPRAYGSAGCRPPMPAGAWVADRGGVFVAGDVGPFAPYLPGGAYL